MYLHRFECKPSILFTDPQVQGDVVSCSTSGNTIRVSASHPSVTSAAASSVDSVDSAITLHMQSQAQRPPSPADRDLLSSNTASDFMSSQPQRNEASKNEQPDVSRDLQRLMNCSAVGLDVFNNPSFATSLRPTAMNEAVMCIMQLGH